MQLGLFDLFDQIVAEALGVDVETFVRVIESESVSDEEQEQIIMGVLEGDNDSIQKSKELFEIKRGLGEIKS
jgi:tRNA A-37 threonylcarbamoyl transferase component Bud32